LGRGGSFISIPYAGTFPLFNYSRAARCTILKRDSSRLAAA
jgi:hypothetical protein